MSSRAAAHRAGATRSLAQTSSLLIGLWWTSNGIGALALDPNFATRHVHGGGDVFGLTTVTANGWHGLFHLLPGLLGILSARRPRAAVRYALVAGALYVAVGIWGLAAGGSSLGVIAVDASGQILHLVEGLALFGAGAVTVLIGARRVSRAAPISTSEPTPAAR